MDNVEAERRRFVRDVVCRSLPKLEKLDDAIAYAEGLWADLLARGYGPDPVAPPPALAQRHEHIPPQPPREGAAKSVRELLADLHHWENMRARKPDALDTAVAYNAARRALGYDPLPLPGQPVAEPAPTDG